MTDLELHPSTREQPGDFNAFKKFIRLKGVDRRVVATFVSFLRDLYDATSSEWRPSGCYATEFIEISAKQLLRQDKYTKMRITPRSWAGDGHFWLVASIEGCPDELVIDPSGVPTLGKDYHSERRTIVPFFGKEELASRHSAEIYSEGKPLTNGVYHIFHP